MAKIVYNACFGGFSISDAALRRYAEIKGLTLYPEEGPISPTYWTVPESARVGKVIDGSDFYAASQEERIASNKFYSDNTIGTRDFERDDPVLVQVVEELGAAADGMCARLRIVEVPSGSHYRIDEYDGSESVETPDSYDWKVAR